MSAADETPRHPPESGTQTADVVVDQYGVIARWSAAAERCLGFTASEVEGEAASDFLAARLEARPDEADRVRRGREAPVALRCRDGRTAAFQVRICPTAEPPGCWNVVLTPMAEISEARAVDDAVLDALFNRSPTSLCVYDPELRLRRFNPAARGMPGVFEQQIVLLAEASSVIGTSLDVMQTGQQLANVSVPRLADAITIDLFAPVLAGENPAARSPAPTAKDLLRVGMRFARDRFDLTQTGRPGFPYPSSVASLIQSPEPRQGVTDLPADDGEPLYRGTGGKRSAHSLVMPVTARGSVLGFVSFYKFGLSGPFTEFDVMTCRELVSRAALSIDNARQHTRERNTARGMQRDLSPQGIVDHGLWKRLTTSLPPHRKRTGSTSFPSRAPASRWSSRPRTKPACVARPPSAASGRRCTLSRIWI